jgi:lipopolysaccharide transport system permease protein
MATVAVEHTATGMRHLFSIIHRNWALTWMMAKREVTDRHVGQMLGMAWAIGHPLLLILVYVFVFGFVFKTRAGVTTNDVPIDYALYLLAGIIPWMAINDCMNKSCSLLTGNASLVKQVVFPLEVLPIKGILATLFPQAICTLLLVIYTLCTTHLLPWTYALLPLVLIMQVLTMCAISFLLGSVSPFFRDIKDIVQVFSVVGVYLAPVVYLPDMVPNLVRPLLYLNPFSHLIWCYQDVCYFGRIEHPWSWVAFLPSSVLGCVVGYALFTKLKPYFGNVL